MRISDWSSDVGSSDLQSQRARLLNSLLVQVDAHGSIALKRAPDVKAACASVLGDTEEPFLLPLRALQGFIGAFEWRRKGVAVPTLAQPIHVHYGVFSPIRGEYLDLVANAPLPATSLAFDIGTGSGVRSAGRRVGKAGVRTCRSRGSPCHKK